MTNFDVGLLQKIANMPGMPQSSQAGLPAVAKAPAQFDRTDIPQAPASETSPHEQGWWDNMSGIDTKAIDKEDLNKFNKRFKFGLALNTHKNELELQNLKHQQKIQKLSQ